MRQDQTIDRSGPSRSRVRVKLVATLLLLPLLHHWAGMASTELPGGCPGFQCLQQPVHNRGTEKTQIQQRSILCLASASRQTYTFMMVHISHHSSSRTTVRKTTDSKDDSGPSQFRPLSADAWQDPVLKSCAPMGRKVDPSRKTPCCLDGRLFRTTCTSDTPPGHSIVISGKKRAGTVGAEISSNASCGRAESTRVIGTLASGNLSVEVTCLMSSS